MMDVEEFRKAGYQAIDRICDYWKTIEKRPVVAPVEPGYLKALVPMEAPTEGENFQVIADDFQRCIMPGITHWQHPSFFGYFPAASTFEGTLGDLYASSVTSPCFNWLCSPAATELEAITMDWAARMFGLDDVFLTSSGKGGGVMQPTASDSCLTAAVAARARYLARRPGTPLEKLVIYGTTMTHSLAAKAALILGLKFRALEVSAEDNFGLRGETLRQAIEEDVTVGNAPFFLISTLGTTSSGAIDNMTEIGEVASRYPGIWVHVDAAWAGVALACPEFRETAYLPAINRYATSLSTNFHKWGLVNLEATGMWVRDRRLLTDSLDVTPEFLKTKQSDSGMVIDYRNWQLPLGRRFRALKLWFVLRSYGVEGVRAHIRRGCLLANHFAASITKADTFELVVPRSLALVVFRAVPGPEDPEVSLEEVNDLNRILLQKVQARSDIFMIQTDLQGKFCLRFAVGAERTKIEHVEEAVAILEKEAMTAREEWRDARLSSSSDSSDEISD